MHKPTEPDTGAAVQTRALAPWLLFAVLLLAGLVAFFMYGDRVPSLLQAMLDR
jgi:hypothetical protein